MSSALEKYINEEGKLKLSGREQEVWSSQKAPSTTELDKSRCNK